MRIYSMQLGLFMCWYHDHLRGALVLLQSAVNTHTNNIDYLPVMDYALWGKFVFPSRISCKGNC